MSRLSTGTNQSIYYELIAGDDEKPILLFLHEGLGCTAMWKDFPALLCRETGCPGLVYDRFGYGQSSPLESRRSLHYLHEYALQELPRLVSGVIPDRDFILLGHSDGGSIALLFAAEKPSALKAVITEAAHVFVEEKTIKGIQKAQDAFDNGKLGGLDKYHGEKTRNLFHAWSDTWLSPGFRHWNIEYALPSIDCPLLVIQGIDDQYGSELQVDVIVEKSAGWAESFWVSECGHSPHVEQTVLVLERMTTFIECLQRD